MSTYNKPRRLHRQHVGVMPYVALGLSKIPEPLLAFSAHDLLVL